MAGRRFSRSGGRRRGPARKKIWARRIIGESELAASATAHSLVLADFETAYGAQLIGCTVARVRMQLFADSTALAGMLFGLRVGSVDAVSDLAVAPSYGPGTRPHLDWMAWGHILSTSVEAADHEVDVRSMRKLDELGQNLILSVENTSGTTAINWGGVLSILVMLP